LQNIKRKTSIRWQATSGFFWYQMPLSGQACLNFLQVKNALSGQSPTHDIPWRAKIMKKKKKDFGKHVQHINAFSCQNYS
jgi:hypothetical protein